MGENIKFKQSNTIQWHDLSKDLKDLPKEDCGTYIAYNIYDETPDLYEYKNSEEGCWELLPSKKIFYSNNQIKVWCEIPKLENKTEPQELCETAILKDVIITNANNTTNMQPVFSEQDLENTDLIKQLAKCSDKIKELEQKIVKKKKKISKLKSKNSNFRDIINNFVLENKYLKDKYETLEASCIEAKLDIEGISESEHDLIVKCSELEKCMKVIKETLNTNLNNETKLLEIKKIIDF